MAQDVTMLVCNTSNQAQTAAGFLVGQGFTIVVNEQTQHSLYDAATHDGGMTEHQVGKWVVIGRK